MSYFNRFGLAAIGVVLVGALVVFFMRSAATVRPPPPNQNPPSHEVKTSLDVAPAPVQQGGTIHLSGQGFSPGETVVVRVAKSANQAGASNPSASGARSTGVALTQTRADDHGVVTAVAVTLPSDLYSGIYPVEAVGQTSGRHASSTVYVHAKDVWINVGTYTVKPPSAFGLVVGGFAPKEQVQVSLEPSAHPANGQAQDPTRLSGPMNLTTIRTDAVGNAVWTETKIPLIKPGVYTLTARGATSGKKVTADLTVQALTPTVQLSPWSGPPGSRVELNGRGFAPSEKVQVFLDTGASPLINVDADRYGNFWGAGPIRVPYRANGGTLTLRFVGAASGAEVTQTFNVQAAKPWLDLNQYWGLPGSTVSFSGGGWAAGERVTFHLGSDSGAVVGASQADQYGWLQLGGAGAVPSDASNSVTFVAVGEQSHATATATFKVASLDIPQPPPPPQLPPQN